LILVWEISKETGLFTEEQKDESYRFIHLTFCEYLATLYAVESGNKYLELIESHEKWLRSDLGSERTRLNEVVPFSCGLLPANKRSTAVDAISLIPDLRLQALSFLESKLYDDHYWPDFKERIQKFLVSTLSEKSGSWFQLFRIFA